MAKRTTEYVKLAWLSERRAPTNSKGHDAAGIAASIRRFGFVEVPTLDERTEKLVAGHGRLDELESAFSTWQPGDALPDGIELDDDGDWIVPLTRGWASENDAEAEAYGIAANQLTIAGGWDHDTLVAQLARVQATPLQFDGLGFEREELDLMLAGMAQADAMPTKEWNTNAAVDNTVAFRFGDYSGKVQRDVYDCFLKRFETLREANDAVMLDEVLVAWLKLDTSG